MKKLLVSLAALLLVITVMPAALAVSTGGGITPDITPEHYAPRIWMCDSRVVYDDATEPGRISGDGQRLVERINNYAFEGEQIKWDVLVQDKNGVEKIEHVFATVGDQQGEGNDVEVNCQRKFVRDRERIPESCNARILEEQLHEFDADTMDENEFWFLNPVIALNIDGDLTFEDVRPGTSSYSDTLLVGNEADVSSGVLLDMFISGTDFYDSSSSHAACPDTNQLSLSAFRYFATNGAYSTSADLENDAVDGDRDTDAEGYVNIEYGIGFNNPDPFYNNAEILQAPMVGPYYPGNILAPGAEMALTFRLNLPEPCNGDFDSGSIFFWGEAI